MLITEHNVPLILEKVNELLKAGEAQGVHLQTNGFRLDPEDDDGWLYITVVPSIAGQSAYDYARYMSVVERSLRLEGYHNVLLVPTLED